MRSRALSVARVIAGPGLVRFRRLRGRAAARRDPITSDGRGYISVVIPVHNVAPYIDACLESVLGQSHWRLQVIAVDDASDDDTPQRLQRWSARDRRVSIVTRATSAGPNAARNEGIARATGEYLTFVDGDDLLLAGAYRDAVASLAASDSDFAVASYERLSGSRRTPPAFWIRDAHAVPRSRATLKSAPDIMVNAVQWTKVYKREFWSRAQLVFPVDGFYQDQIVSAAGFARARAFDILGRTSVLWRIRRDGTSMTQLYRSIDNLRDRFSSATAALHIYRDEAPHGVWQQRLVQFLSNDLAITASHIGELDDAGWEVVRRGLHQMAEEADEFSLWSDVPAEFKVLFHFISINDRARALEYIERGGLRLHDHQLVTVGGDTFIALPFWKDHEAAVPVDRFRASPRELRAFEGQASGNPS
nr:glycosyltransferase family A protein [Leifsonia flava]